jgi:hypothetical protein
MRLVLATLTLVPLVALAAPAHATAGPVGLTCGASVQPDPADPTRTYAEVDAGPIVVAEAGGTAHTGRITCTIQLGQRHAAPDLVSVSGPETPYVATLPATPVTYETPATDVYLCTELRVDGETLYFDESDDATVEPGWSTDPTVARCAWLGAEDCPDCGPPPPVWEQDGFVESIVCPFTALVFPPDGSVPPVLDCADAPHSR